ncbi:aldehyde dehydrogenase family protein [Microbacterium sp. RD1]|uniref:aldehyde dehydrogenase family protein n=1 Tax=Microbacterium sp. RD1 TaxID=3457313 RepID=UPI003FA5BB18
MSIDVPASALTEADRESIDAALSDLETGSRLWSTLSLGHRARLLERLHDTVGATASEWADAAATAKELPPGHPLRGEEWLTGPYTTLIALDAARDTLRALAERRSPLDGVRIDDAPGGRLRAHVFPAAPLDRLVLSGFTGEVWFEPGVTRGQAIAAAGLGQRSPSRSGGVGLVLGAGNVTSIPVLDVVYELLSANRVSLLKVNPTQDPLVPVLRRALAPLIEPGFLRIVRGGADVGAHLTQHPGFSHVHITGSAATFDAIVWGSGADAARRRKADDPALRVPITAELGGVAPVIVVPGAWSEADLRFQAEHVATMRLQNSGHNCVAAQVVILSADWPQRGAFLAELRRAYAAAPARPVWYPRSDAALAAAKEAYPDAAWLGDGTRALVRVEPDAPADPVETTEYFAPVLGVVTLPGSGQAFLDAAVAHANDRLTGSLGANVLIDPVTETTLGEGFERAIADLRYGGIAINTWTGVSFTVPALSWGAYPGGTAADVGSGIGVVHNARLLDRVERSVLRGPFRPFPRAVPRPGRRARFTVLPKPPWFVSARTGAAVSEGLTRFQIDRDYPRLAATLLKAFRA